MAPGSRIRPATATITPASQVTMVTLAFSGVNLSKPVDSLGGSGSGTSPKVTTSSADDVLVYGEGSSGKLAAAHPAIVSDLLKAQIQANSFITSDPSAAQADANAELAVYTGKALKSSIVSASFHFCVTTRR